MVPVSNAFEVTDRISKKSATSRVLLKKQAGMQSWRSLVRALSKDVGKS
jgi:hypothetical protein